MYSSIRMLLALAVLLSASLPVWAAPPQSEHDHFDVLAVSPTLTLSDVLERTFARHPRQASLQSLDSVVSARKTVANAMLPSAPAVTVFHQSDVLGSGRGERESQAELELPVWLPDQRNQRSKVADASQSSVTASRESLKLQVAGQLREALWDVAMNDNLLALAVNKLELANRLQLDVEKRHRAGEMAKTDVMLAQQETLRAEKDKLRAEAEVMHARHRYFLLTGLRELPANYEENLSAHTDYSQSPIWTEAQSKVGLAEAERALAQVESNENLQLSLNMRSIKGGFDRMGNESVGVRLRIPFGGEARAAPLKAAAEVGFANALSDLESLKLALEGAMHEVEHNLTVSRKELALANQQFDIAKESARLAEKAFKLGEADLVSLLRVQSQAYEAERAYTTRKIQLQWDIARYNQVVGVLP